MLGAAGAAPGEYPLFYAGGQKKMREVRSAHQKPCSRPLWARTAVFPQAEVRDHRNQNRRHTSAWRRFSAIQMALTYRRSYRYTTRMPMTDSATPTNIQATSQLSCGVCPYSMALRREVMTKQVGFR